MVLCKFMFLSKCIDIMFLDLFSVLCMWIGLLYFVGEFCGCYVILVVVFYWLIGVLLIILVRV